MAHAGPADLDRLASLLDRLRALPDLRERSRGVFYRRSKAFVHFHVLDGEPFADLRAPDHWLRYPVGRAREQGTLVADARRLLRGEVDGLRGRRF